MNEIRIDVTTGDSVLIATARASRPYQYKITTPRENLPETNATCPFCEGNEEMTPPETGVLRESGEPNGPGWKARIVPNLYPAVTADAELLSNGGGFGAGFAGRGIHEVYIESPRHNLQLFDLEPEQMFGVYRMVAERVRELASVEGIAAVSVFKNSGIKAGVSLIHPHGQIVALPMVPPAVLKRLAILRMHKEQTGRDLFDDILEQERAFGGRIVCEGEHTVALCPYAPKTAFEVWIIPKKRACGFAYLDNESLRDFTDAMRDVLVRMRAVLGFFDFNIAFVDCPAGVDTGGLFHGFAKIMPRMSHIAGFELGTEMFMNTHSPEMSADVLRQAE